MTSVALVLVDLCNLSVAKRSSPLTQQQQIAERSDKAKAAEQYIYIAIEQTYLNLLNPQPFL